MKTAATLRTLGLLGALLSLACAAPARAADKPKETGEGASAPTIQMESVALPVIVNGALINYVFVSIRLELYPHTDGSAVRLKEQYFRDDLVRSGHRTPFTRMDDYTHLDEAKVRAEILKAAVGIVGANVIKNAVITKQVSQKMLTLPKVARPKASPYIEP